MLGSVANYKLLAELGEGAMGTVYRALDMHLEREVALKSLRPQLARRSDVVERFREEAKLQARIESPHVVRLYQFLREGNDFFLVMEFVKGETLGNLLKQRGRLSVRDAIEIMIQALDGLGDAHKRNIVHRDVKPANIMVRQDGVVKVADFGIARLVSSPRQTKFGSVIGTLEYISPEAVEGKEATAVSDIYSCGVVLYELLTGQLPFNSPSEYELARAQVKDKPPPLRKWVPEIPRALENEVLRAMAKKPADRFQSAEQMAQALRSCLPDPSGSAVSQEKGGFFDKIRSALADANPGELTMRGRSTPESLRRQSPLLERDETAGNLRKTALKAVSRQVDVLLGQRDWNLARQEIEKMRTLFPDEAALTEMSSRIDREERHYEEGVLMAIREGQNLLERGLPEAAKKAIELSLQRFHADTRLSNLLRRAENELLALATRSSEADQVVVRVNDLQKAGKHAEAVAIAIDAMARFQNQPQITALVVRAVKVQKIEACREQVDALKVSGDWVAAFSAIDQLLQLYPEEPLLLELRHSLEEERERQRQSQEVEQILARAAELQHNGQSDQAESAVNEALSRLTNIPAALSAQLIETSGGLKTARFEKLAAAAIVEAKSLENEREWQRAIDVLNDAISEVPGVPRLSEVRIEIERARDNYLRDVREALEDGRKLLAGQRYEDAFLALSASSQRFPRETGVSRLLLEAQQKLTAERRQRQLNNARAKASELLTNQAFEEAEQFLLDAISRFPEDPGLTDLLSAAIQGRREQEKKHALEQATKSVKQLAHKKLYAEAIRVLDDVLTVHASEPSLEAQKREMTECLREERRIRLVADLQAWSNTFGHEKFNASLEAVDQALLEYPNDPDFMSIRKTIEAAKRTFDRSKAESETVARSADLETRGLYKDALDLVEAELARYPESKPLARLATSIQRRLEDADKLRRAGEAEREIRRLLAENPRSARDRMNAALAQFPQHERFQTLNVEVEDALREFDLKDSTRLVHESIASRAWNSADAIVGELESKYGSNTSISGLRHEVTSARQAREKSLEETVARARASLASEDFIGAISLIEALKLDGAERDGFTELLASARSGLESQVFEKAFQELRDQVSDALQRSDVDLATRLVSDAQSRYENYTPFREVEHDVRRERDIRAAIDKTVDYVTARAWMQAIEHLESAIKQFGADRRISDRLAQVRDEYQARHAAAEALVKETRSLWQAGQYDRSIQQLIQGVAEFPEEAVLAESLHKARQELSLLLRADKVRDLEQRARSLIAANQPDEAETVLQQARAHLEDDPVILDLIEAARATRHRLDEIKSCIDSIQTALKAGDTDRAESLWLEGLQQFPDVAAVLELRRKIAEAKLVGTLTAARRRLVAGNIQDAKSILAGAIEEYGPDPRLTALDKEVAEAERRKAEIGGKLTDAQNHFDAGRIQVALRILDNLPAWATGDSAIAEMRVRCQRVLSWQKDEYQRISSRVEALGRRGLYGDAISLLETGSAEPHLQPILQPLLERLRTTQQLVTEQLSNVRQVLAKAGPAAALELIRQSGPETRQHADFERLREQCEKELKATQRATTIAELPKHPILRWPFPPLASHALSPPRATLWVGLALLSVSGLFLILRSLPSHSVKQDLGSTQSSISQPVDLQTKQSKVDQPHLPEPKGEQPEIIEQRKLSLSVTPRRISVDYSIPMAFPAPYKIAVTAPTRSLPFSVAVTKGGDWLSVSPDSASTPATLTMSLRLSGLKAGAYEGEIRCTTDSGRPTIIPVDLTIHAFSIK